MISYVLPPASAGRPGVGAVLSRRLAENLASLHSVDPAQIVLDTFGRPTGFLRRTLEGWVTRGRAIADLVNAHAFAEMVGWLRCRVSSDAQASLLHSDL